MFNDIIELLLIKKATLREELEKEFAVRDAKIDSLLEMTGYVKPVVEEAATAEEISSVEEAAEEIAETKPMSMYNSLSGV